MRLTCSFHFLLIVGCDLLGKGGLSIIGGGGGCTAAAFFLPKEGESSWMI